MGSTRLRALAVALLAVVFFAAACGGGDDDQPASSGGTGDTETEENGDDGENGGGDVALGEEKFASTCSACHGPDGKGLPNLGKDFTKSEFVKGLSDDELVDFIKKGRDTSDPLNTTGVAMPPKGGNPALSDDDLDAIVAYIRTLQE